MPDIERHLGGIVTIKRETYEDRAKLVAVADRIRAGLAAEYFKEPTEWNRSLHYKAYQKVVDLQTNPLTDRVKVLGILIPIVAGLLLPPRWFVKEPADCF